jgi:hypothetical protein
MSGGVFGRACGSGSQDTARIVAREGRFACDGPDGEPRRTATGGVAEPFPVNKNAHITVTAPFVPAGQGRAGPGRRGEAMTVRDFLARINAYGETRILIFHYQIGPAKY